MENEAAVIVWEQPEMLQAFTNLPEIETGSTGLVINNKDGFAVAAQWIDQLKGWFAKAEELRKEEKAPYLEMGQQTDAKYKTITVRITPLIERLNEIMGGYQMRLRQAEREKQEAVEKELREVEDSIFKNIQEEGVVAPQLPLAPPPPPPAPPARAQTASGSVGMMTVWQYEVVDLNLVPREWLMLDDALVSRSIKRKDDPVREIPGIKIYDKYTTATKGKK